MTLRLPLGDQSFAQIRDEGLLYADKTEYIYKLLKSAKQNYFLSRPRRFGKTLLLHTINELCSGNRERFQGLWIDSSDYAFPELPVIFLSLSIDATTPEMLRQGLMDNLRDIAATENLEVQDASYDIYFGFLIEALCLKKNQPVLILIDEFDSPVIRNMDNNNIAQANANILQHFLAILKAPLVSPCISFTLVTGLTRYALSSMESDPNHLNDISLEPEYAGICGFTLNEFESLFADRLDLTLTRLKKSGEIDSSANLVDLKDKIYEWYDGYSWDGYSRILNPYSILNFFDKNSFDNYWIQSSRPGYLTSLIKARPWNFLDPQLESYLSEDVKNSELSQLRATPLLFHSGYLTVDRISKIEKIIPLTSISIKVTSYSFKLPNYEITSSYYEDCFKVILDFETTDTLKNYGQNLLNAFLTRNGQTVSSILSDLFARINFFQRPKDPKTFLVFLQLLLSAMRFKAQSERLDLCLALTSQISLIIELKYCSDQASPTEDENNEALVKATEVILPEQTLNKVLAKAVQNKLSSVELLWLLLKGQTTSQYEDKIKILANSATEYLTEAEINHDLAILAKKEFSKEDIATILKNVKSKSALTNEQVDEILSKAAANALKDITERDYHSIIGGEAKEIIDLGLAVYGDGSRVMAIFGSK
ncbi:MAG: AAA family ATPase [Deltaproteobacteria bacterium]|jgi:hypothetical protein|nr:AAA family ATPase [Deltaproteobacteria bacterium]